MRNPSPRDFALDVEGIGRFVFGRKTVMDALAIECEYTRLTEGLDVVPDYLGVLASAIANLRILTVKAPDGWDIEGMDGEDEETYTRLKKVWGALRDKLASFRAKPGAPVEDGGQGSVEDGRVLVSP